MLLLQPFQASIVNAAEYRYARLVTMLGDTSCRYVGL